jgi:molybdenum cofactor biosynthesis enzyme MoaA
MTQKKGWDCPAIKHGLAIFPNGKIGPCYQIKTSYLKPISEINNPERFDDLITLPAPSACHNCVSMEVETGYSLRKKFMSHMTHSEGIQYLDMRNTNLCNLKCRYCTPYFSDKWGEELGYEVSLNHQDIQQYKDIILTESLHWLYFTGGEPFMSKDHWDLLEELIARGFAKNIDLQYSTNMTMMKYKDKDIRSLWKEFKTVDIRCSIDAMGEPLNYIRSGADWNVIQKNLETLIEFGQEQKIEITIAPVISLMNIWFFPDFFKYIKEKNLKVQAILLRGPDFLSLSAIPDEYKELALSKVAELRELGYEEKDLKRFEEKINDNKHKDLFKQTMAHILLLDKTRNEKLFDILPFRALAIENISGTSEYDYD